MKAGTKVDTGLGSEKDDQDLPLSHFLQSFGITSPQRRALSPTIVVIEEEGRDTNCLFSKIFSPFNTLYLCNR